MAEILKHLKMFVRDNSHQYSSSWKCSFGSELNFIELFRRE